jgi:hypothetical protein
VNISIASAYGYSIILVSIADWAGWINPDSTAWARVAAVGVAFLLIERTAERTAER